jgi:hypothetical protein
MATASAEATTEEAVIYLGADPSCRRNATHNSYINQLNHPHWQCRVYKAFYLGFRLLVKLMARSLARWSNWESPFTGTHAE